MWRRRRDMGLGSLDAVTLAQARRERDRWAAVLASGRDPISERARERDAAATREELGGRIRWTARTIWWQRRRVATSSATRCAAPTPDPITSTSAPRSCRGGRTM
ncbi:Arm DNA-binding domain-containing protein [Rhodobacter capsulatus]|uniref:Arm DNA-binding domain-containing protein n=1 Tax=Rhodobacter capsulatus TaxID=1061 RepID=UPI00373FD093